MKYVLGIISLVFLFSNYSQAKIYKWVDANGVQQFSSQPPPEGVKSEQVKIQSYKNSSDNKPSNTQSGDKTVIIYSTKWCSVCKKAKRYFKSQNIRFTEYDIEESFQAKLRFKKLGGKGVPLILVNKKKLRGFSVDSFKKMYGS